jgi:hypothetical protein
MEAFRKAILALPLETHLDPEPSIRFHSLPRARSGIHLGAHAEGGWQGTRLCGLAAVWRAISRGCGRFRAARDEARGAARTLDFRILSIRDEGTR